MGGAAVCWSGGLSPLVRGNQRAQWQALAAAGSIPACAGEPRMRAHEAGRPKVYPRLCGGNPGPGAPDAARARSIPACAGEP